MYVMQSTMSRLVKVEKLSKLQKAAFEVLITVLNFKVEAATLNAGNLIKRCEHSPACSTWLTGPAQPLPGAVPGQVQSVANKWAPLCTPCLQGF